MVYRIGYYHFALKIKKIFYSIWLIKISKINKLIEIDNHLYCSIVKLCFWTKNVVNRLNIFTIIDKIMPQNIDNHNRINNVTVTLNTNKSC